VENGVASGDSFWTALAERSGDSAFDGTIPAVVFFQSGVALRLPPQSKMFTGQCHFKNTP
jgi:hypothetical protein